MVERWKPEIQGTLFRVAGGARYRYRVWRAARRRLHSARLVRAVDSASGTFTFGYGAAGLLAGTVNSVGAVNYTRDALGRVTQRQVVGQTAQTHTYDDAGNLLTAALGGTSVSYGYDVLNRVTSMNRGKGVNTTFAYDPAGRLKSITHGTIGMDQFEYDAAGQRVKRTTPFAQALTTTASTTTVDDANRIVTRDAATHTHDFNGNRTGDGTNTYVWDSRNRLTSMTTRSETFTFTYDPAGNLIRQTAPSGTQEFVLDDLTNIAYTNGTSFLTARGIDSHLAAIASGSPTYALTDAINSTSATTDATGAVQTRYFYEPYGQTSSTGPGSYLFQYTGRVPVVGNIYHYRARFYDAVAGRFLSEDSIDSTNSYAYVSNDPITFVDPLGLVEQPGFWEGFIPIWESGKQAIHDFECGNWGWGAFNTGMAVLDVTGTGSLAKGGWKLGSHTWKMTRKWLTKKGLAEPGQIVHHALVPQRAFGKSTAWFFNQWWNLKPLNPPAGINPGRWHMMVEGRTPGLNFLQRWWYGMPTWWKGAQISLTGKGMNATRSGCGCQ
jgi:RHS repeat-associated protein